MLHLHPQVFFNKLTVLGALRVLREHYKIVVSVGVELEFYSGSELFPEEKASISSIDMFRMSTMERRFRFIQEIKKEMGLNQYEIVTFPSGEVIALIEDIVEFKKYLLSTAKNNDIKMTFSAKPYATLPGSSMHINLTFYELMDNKLIDAQHQLFSSIVAGMCYYMRSLMLNFAPNVESYQRFHYADIHTPSFINWGFNNRSVAVRVVSGKYKNFRIEHRVSGSDADIDNVVESILVSVIMGMKNKLKNAVSEFGVMDYNGGYKQRLPMTLTEAIRFFEELKLDFV